MQGKNNDNSWEKSLAQAFTKLADLLDYLELTADDFSEKLDFQPSFKFMVTREFASRMEKRNPRDPLLLQVLPQAAENNLTPGFMEDPLDEKKFNPVPGLLHKYPSRVLLTLTPSCPINCRYCFRRHFDYESNQLTDQKIDKIIEYIKADSKINEVIFSGGEPLLLKDQKLAELIQRLESIPHLTTLRIHTRMPIVLPQRITERFIKTITQTRLKPVLIIHANHPNELDDEVAEKCSMMQKAGIILLHQAVLLKHINANSLILKKLCQHLFSLGILPYYVHQLDPVTGTAHFEIPLNQAKQLQQELTEILPGYCVPKFVMEVAGKKSKMLVSEI